MLENKKVQRILRIFNLSDQRRRLLSTAAMVTTVIVLPVSAIAGPDGCVISGTTTATCQGDQSGGIASGTDFTAPPVTTLNVNNLTQAIGPTSGTDGISFTSSNGITINADTGTYGISATGGGANAINVYLAGNADISITSTGNLNSAAGSGIISVLQGDGDNTLDITGTIEASGPGILAVLAGEGDISVTSSGNITTTGTGYSGFGSSGGIVAFGFGGLGGTGTNVSVTSNGDINTAGDSSQGIVAANLGNTGDITVNSTGDINTAGYTSFGIIGYAGYNGDISVTSIGNITTQGDRAYGIFAYAYEGNGDIIVNSTGDLEVTGDNSGGIQAEINSYSGNGNATGNITITSIGDIIASGYDSEGIDAEHNGTGNITITSTGDITAGDGGEAIDAYAYYGSVSINSTGDLTASGSDSEVIFAYSYGGTTTVTQTGDITMLGGDNNDGILTYSDGGATNVTMNGDLTVTGTNSHGIHVNSVTADGIDATVTLNGNLTVTGANADGIFSDNGNGAGTTTFNILAGSTVTAGADTNAAIKFDNGLTNTLENAGTIIGLGNYAVEGDDDANDIINNTGTITGNITLGTGENTIANLAGGTLNSGATLNVGAGNTLTNAGTLSSGGTGTIATTAITGNLDQTATGILAVDADFAIGTADLVTVTGTADLAGTVSVSSLNVSNTSQQFTILTAAGGVTDSGVTLTADFATSVLANAELQFLNSTDLVLSFEIDFSAEDASLNPNQTNIANNLNEALDAGGGGLDPVFDALLAGSPTLNAYASNLDQLSPEVFLNTQISTLYSATSFINNLFSCRTVIGESSFLQQSSDGNCFWVRPEGRFVNRDDDSNNIGFSENIGSISGGAQMVIAPDWQAGFGLGYDYATLENSSNAESDSHRFNVGGMVKYQPGRFSLSGALSGGIASFDTERSIDFGGFEEQAKSDYNIKYLTGQLRAAYLMPQGNWYARPQIDFNVTYLNRDGFTESGGGAANLSVDSSSETYLSISPSVEIAGDYSTKGGYQLQPYLKAGVTIYQDSDHSLSASFANSPSGVGDFDITTEFAQIFGDLSVGVITNLPNGTTLNIGYEGSLSSDIQQHSLFLMGAITF